MTSNKTNPLNSSSNDQTNSQPTRRQRQPSPNFSAQQKAQAVLAVWTERARPAEVCRQLQINWITFNQWQQRALEGMMQALEPRVNLTKGEVLSPRLQTLLQKQQRSVSLGRLSSRLEQLRQSKLAPKPEPVSKIS
jgi:transposase-like protein